MPALDFYSLIAFRSGFFSTLANFLGLENRILMLPFRAIIASYSLYIIVKYSDNKKLFFLEDFLYPYPLFGFYI